MGYQIVAIGTSLGGLKAVETILSGLTADFPLPIILVQHRSVESRDGLCRVLQRHSALRVVEAEDKIRIQAGKVYVAPSDYHLLVEENQFSLSTQGTVSYARPSIDVLFESVSDAYTCGVIGIVLTGANYDGARGAASIKARGGYLIVQDPETAECDVMPKAAIKAAKADVIAPLFEIPILLNQLISPSPDRKYGNRPKSQHPPGR